MTSDTVNEEIACPVQKIFSDHFLSGHIVYNLWKNSCNIYLMIIFRELNSSVNLTEVDCLSSKLLMK